MLSKAPQAGESFIEVRTGKMFCVIDCPNVRVNGKWQKGVLYAEEKRGNNQFSVRLLGDFMHAFKKPLDTYRVPKTKAGR